MSTPTHASVGFRSERGPILIALMLSTGLVAIDSTILATAVPSIVNDLGGFAAVPLAVLGLPAGAGGLGAGLRRSSPTSFGRKPIMLFGIGLFLLGSMLCGFAWSMPALIAFRAVQGLGAGAVQPMAITIAGDIYTVAERAKAQGYLASVWAISVGRRADPRRGVLAVPAPGAGSSSSTCPLCIAGRVDADPPIPRDRSSAAGTASTTPGAVAAHGRLTLLILGRARGRPGVGLELAV